MRRAFRSSSFLPNSVESITPSVMHRDKPAEATAADASPAITSTTHCTTPPPAPAPNASYHRMNAELTLISRRKKAK